MSSRWVPVFEGTMPEVLVLQSSCEAGGIPTFVPDLNLAYLDPSARGGNFFALKLLVPEDRLTDARELVPARKRSAIPGVEAEPSELARMGSRVRICALLLVTAPLAVWFGLQYMKEMHTAGELPAGHDWTVRTFWFALALCVLVPLAYLAGLLRPGLWQSLAP